MDYSTEEQLWNYLEIKYNYDDNILMIIYDFESYYEIKYVNAKLRQIDLDLYDINKLKDPSGKLEEFGKQLFEFNKKRIDKFFVKNKK